MVRYCVQPMATRRETSRSVLTGSFVVLGLATSLALSPGDRHFWPFCHWWLYHTGTPRPLETISVVELHVVSADASVHRLWPRDLFTLDDDSSSQDSGPWLIERALDQHDPKRPAYERALWSRAEHVLNREAARVELWELTWAVDNAKHPPLQLDSPLRRRHVHTLSTRTAPSQQ